MNILHVTHGYYPETTGGVEEYLRMTAAAQHRRGHQVRVLTGSIEPRDRCTIEPADFEGVPVLRLHRDDWYNDHYAHSYHPEVTRMLRQLLAEDRPDLVHVHQWLRLTSDIVEIARDLGVATVVTLHDVYTSCPRAFRVDRDGQPCDRVLSAESCRSCVPRFGRESDYEIDRGIELFRDQYRAELAAADRILIAAEATADLLSRTTGAPREHFVTHDLPYRPRFADLPRLHRDDPLRFGYWGTLTPHKGPHVLLDALRAARPRIPQAIELHLFGPMGTEQIEERLRTAATGLPVTFHGPFDAPQLAAAALHVAVFPVLCFEGFGLGLTEAFELGLPAIVSDIGALGARIGDAGIKVPPGDVDALADALVTLATDADARERMAAAIPPLPVDPDGHAEALEEHYRFAREAKRPKVPGISIERRADFILVQRESALRALRDATGERDPF